MFIDGRNIFEVYFNMLTFQVYLFIYLSIYLFIYLFTVGRDMPDICFGITNVQ